MMKACSLCNEQKPLEAFALKRAHIGQRNTRCRSCMAKINKEIRHRDINASRQRKSEKMRKLRADPAYKAAEAKRRAEINLNSPYHAFRLGLFNAAKRHPVTITITDLFNLFAAQNGRCAITGLELTWGRGRILPTSLSLDRIDTTKGYELGNVRLLCYAVNCFRQDMSDDDMFAMALAIVTNMKKPKLRLVS